MPYKHSQSRGHKFTKPKYKVTNWPEYNDALRRRGDFTIWFTDDAITDRCPAKTGARGRTQEYSEHAIETALLIRQMFHLALRQAQWDPTDGRSAALAASLEAIAQGGDRRWGCG